MGDLGTGAGLLYDLGTGAGLLYDLGTGAGLLYDLGTGAGFLSYGLLSTFFRPFRTLPYGLLLVLLVPFELFHDEGEFDLDAFVGINDALTLGGGTFTELLFDKNEVFFFSLRDGSLGATDFWLGTCFSDLSTLPYGLLVFSRREPLRFGGSGGPLRFPLLLRDGGGGGPLPDFAGVFAEPLLLYFSIVGVSFRRCLELPVRTGGGGGPPPLSPPENFDGLGGGTGGGI